MTAPELSRPVRIDTLGEEPRALAVETDEAERAALAARFGLIAVDRLSADVTLVRHGETVDCAGTLRAAVAQACVATGDPVPAELDEPFAVRFAPPRAGTGDEEVELDAGDLDVIDYHGGAVDVGEAVAQTLALALDPFPRCPGADAALDAAGVIGEADTGPFAVLKALKDRL